MEELAGIGSWEWDATSGLLQVSEGFWQLLGRRRAPADLRGEALVRLALPADRSVVRAALERAASGPGEQRAEFRIRDRQGIRILSGRTETRARAGGLLVRGVLRDVTEVRRATALADGQRRLLELIATDAPLLDVLAATTEFVDAHADQTRSSLYLADDRQTTLRLAASPSLPSTWAQATREIPIGPCAGSCGTAAYRRESVIVRDIQRDPLWRDYSELALAHGLRACWSTPILDDAGRVLGTFAMYPARRRAPTPWEHLLAEAATHVARIAVERSRERERLHAADELLRAIMVGSADAIFVRDVEGRYVLVSDMAATLLGRTPEEVIGRPAADFMSPEAATVIGPAYSRVLGELGSVQVAQRVTIGDRERVFEGTISSMRNAAGDIVGGVAIAHDVTERMDAEQALRDEQLRLQLLLAQVPAVVWTTDAALRLLTVDGSAFPASTLQPLVGRNLDEMLGTNSAFAGTRTAHQRALDGERAEFDIPVSDGRTLSARVQPLHDAAGARVGTIGTAVDVTAQRDADRVRQLLLQRLVSMQEDERRRIAHELHDHLGQHLAAFALGLRALEDGARGRGLRERLAAMRETCDTMGREVHDLALRLRPASLDDFGLPSALETLVRGWSAHGEIAVELDAEDVGAERLPHAIETAAYRVVQEALTNVARHAHATHVSVLLFRHAEQLFVVVDDDGVGSDLLTPRSTHRQMGVQGMRERAETLHGSLDVASAPGAGMSVFLRIPLAPVRQGS